MHNNINLLTKNENFKQSEKYKINENNINAIKSTLINEYDVTPELIDLLIKTVQANTSLEYKYAYKKIGKYVK